MSADFKTTSPTALRSAGACDGNAGRLAWASELIHEVIAGEDADQLISSLGLKVRVPRKLVDCEILAHANQSEDRTLEELLSILFMHVLIAPDKFKGTLSAAQAADALAEGWRDGWPADKPLEVERLPVADGGEGTAEAIHDALAGRWVTLAVRDPIGRTVEGRYALVKSASGEGLAVLEMSSASGFSLVRGNDRNLLRGNTFGTGQLLAHALRKADAGRVVVGVGGSATNDGGIGMAAALGFRFLDAEHRELDPTPERLLELASIESPADPWPPVQVDVACDVKNPLLGPRGATRIYGPQKGLRDEAQAEQLELGLARLADVAARTFGRDHRDTPGAGAAGGLGFGLMTFCAAEMLPGFDLVAGLLELETAVARADLVLTGEGSLDWQTLEGKAPAGVAALARRLGRPVIAFGGRIEEGARASLGNCFSELVALSDVEPELTLEQRMTQAAQLLRRHAARLAARVAAAGLRRA
jgi:glycerate kinase